MAGCMEQVLEYLGEISAAPLAAAKRPGRSVGREERGRYDAPAPQISSDAVGVLAKRLSVPAEKVLSVSSIPARTFHRRQQKAEALSATESDRILRIARIAREAERVFGNAEASSRWLTADHPVLGAKPLDLLATDAGSREVEEEIGRIEHGIFA